MKTVKLPVPSQMVDSPVWATDYDHLIFPPTFLNFIPPLDGSHLPQKKNMAPARDKDPEGDSDRVGPLPSFIQVAKPYIFEHTIQGCLKQTGVPLTREDQLRLSGVQWIDNVRKALRL